MTGQNGCSVLLCSEKQGHASAQQYGSDEASALTHSLWGILQTYGEQRRKSVEVL